MQCNQESKGNGAGRVPPVNGATLRGNRDLAAVISHELRIPLAALMGYTSMLSDRAFGPLTYDQAETVRRIDRCARELHNLLNAAFELASVGRQPITPLAAEVDVTELTRNLAQEFQGSLAVGGLRWEISAGLPLIRTDAVRLKMVLRNLIANACKFSGANPVTVEVHRDGTEIEFAVVDAGRGIRPEAQELIFEAYEQVETTDAENGTGLGLYLVRRLVDKLGGTISVESSAGSGSRFCVRIPAYAN